MQPSQEPPSSSLFDLQSYISRYDSLSETRLQRLLHIGRYFHFHSNDNSNNSNITIQVGVGGGSEDDAIIKEEGSDIIGPLSSSTTASSSVAKQAYELAIAQIKQSGNFHRYLEEYGAAMPMAGASTISSMTPELTTSSSPSSTSMMSPQRHYHNHQQQQQQQQHYRHDQDVDNITTTPHHQQEQHNIIIQHYLPTYDSQFIQTSKQLAHAKLEILEGRLTVSQSKLMKESIRLGLLALAMFHKEIGELREAWRRVVRSREYCTTSHQHAQVTLLLLELSIDLRDWPSVHDTIALAERTVVAGTIIAGGISGGGGSSSSSIARIGASMTSLSSSDGIAHEEYDISLFHNKLKAAQGIAYLSEGKYKEAASTFTSISLELTNQFSSVISAEDLALYGALLGWATYDRETVCEVVMEGEFKARLELVPFVREALRHYSRAEYGPCLSYLQPGSSVRRDLEIDLHLHTHVPTLLDMIRDRCILQYFQPYSSVSLEKMGSVFGCDVKEMEGVVSKLISSGGMDGMKFGGRVRIDAHAKTLCVEDPSVAERRERRRVRVMAAKMGVQFKRNAEGMLLRVACISHGFSAQDKNSGKNKGGLGRDVGGRNRSDHMGPDLFESDESVSDDAMDVDNHVVNPNEY